MFFCFRETHAKEPIKICSTYVRPKKNKKAIQSLEWLSIVKLLLLGSNQGLKLTLNH